jgi:hypothetical protein
MLAKITSKNQLTLPKFITSAIGDTNVVISALLFSRWRLARLRSKDQP